MPYLFFTLFISVIVAVFAVQNAVSVSLNFAVWTMQTNLVIVILGSALLGALATLFFTLMMKAKHYLQDKKTREEMAALQKDNAKLREEVAMLMHTQRICCRHSCRSGGFACGGQRVAEPGRQGKRRDQRIFVRQRAAVS